MSEEILQKSENSDTNDVKGDDIKLENKRPLSSASLEFLEILSDVKQVVLHQNGKLSDEQYYNNAKKYWNAIGKAFPRKSIVPFSHSLKYFPFIFRS